MPRTVYDEIFDGRENLISREERTVPDLPPTRAERAAQARALLPAIEAANSIAALRSATLAYLTAIQDVLDDESLR